MKIETTEIDSEPEKRVTPVFSYSKKLEICKIFIESKWNFSTLNPLKQIIGAGLVTPMEELKDFRSSQQVNVGYYAKTEKFYSDFDAKHYFDWLIGIVAGLEDAPIAVFKKAVEQLSAFIYHMRPYTTIEKDPFATPTIQVEIAAMRDELAKLNEGLQQRDDEIVKELTRLNDFLDKYESLFDSLDYEARFGNRIKEQSRKASSDDPEP
jgi:hypothetical protein